MSLLASRYLRRTFGLSRPTPLVRNFTASGPAKGNKLLNSIYISYYWNLINLFQLDIIQDLYVKALKDYVPSRVVI
jgi:hypothetical protein